METERDPDAGFTVAEEAEMKHVYDNLGEDCPDWPFYEELADKLNNSIHRRGKSLIDAFQVYNRFQDLRSMEVETQKKSAEVEKVPVPEVPVPVPVSAKRRVSDRKRKEVRLPNFIYGARVSLKPKLPNKRSSSAIQRCRKSKAAVAAELADGKEYEARSSKEYEAKSSKDLVWYDVSSFQSDRRTASGELEARVRFAYYGKEDDEWLNVKRCIRKRSVRLRDSECEKVKIGDLVLCFRKFEDHTGYMDAHVLGIERNKHHQTKGCTCIFAVRYDDDLSEDRVGLSNICVRPPS